MTSLIIEKKCTQKEITYLILDYLYIARNGIKSSDSHFIILLLFKEKI